MSFGTQLLPLSFLNELEKIAGSRLRSAVQVVPYRHGPLQGFRLMLGDREIGRATLAQGRAQIQGIELIPGFQGMGLGRKLYGEIARRMPNQTLASDFGTSREASAAWRRMAKHPSTEVRERLPGERGPKFIRTLPEKASLHPMRGMQGFPRTRGNTASELAILDPIRKDDRERLLYGILGKRGM